MGSEGDYAIHFDYTDIFVIPDTYSDFYPLHETFPHTVSRVVNPAPSVIHFNNETMQITTFGDLHNETVPFKLYMEGLPDPLEITFSPAPIPTQHGARTCILKELPDIPTLDPSLFRASAIAFCYHTTSFSFTHEDPRTSSSSRYLSTTTLLPITTPGIYSLTLVASCRLQLFLDHFSRPLLSDDGTGSFTHVVTLKLTAVRHRLRLFAFARKTESFALYLHSVRNDMPRRLLAGNDLILPPSAESLDFSFLPRLSLWRNVLFSRALKTAVKGEVAFRPAGEMAVVGGELIAWPRESSLFVELAASSLAGVFSTPAGREMAVEEPTAGIEASL